MSCLVCGGTGITATGLPCTKCDAAMNIALTVNPWVPLQYQGVRYSSAVLPVPMMEWGLEMEQLLQDIASRANVMNYLICSPYRTGKTIWSYDLLDRIASSGQRVAPIADIVEIRRIILSYKEEDIQQLANLLSVPVLIVRIPPIANANIIHTIQTLMYRRVACNGQTIFLYSGDYYTLMDECGNKELMSSILGDGSLGSIKLKNYRRKSNAQSKD